MASSNGLTRIYVVMVADLFHYGHVKFLRRARSYGDYLIVGLTSDEAAERRKRKPILCWEERRRVVEACRYVDEVWFHRGPLCDDFMRRHNLAFRVYAPETEQVNRQFLDRYRRSGLSSSYLRRIDYTQEISTTIIINRVVHAASQSS